MESSHNLTKIDEIHQYIKQMQHNHSKGMATQICIELRNVSHYFYLFF